MSSEVRPITAAAFASALTDLPVENLYAKVFELNNSIAHLEHSNTQLKEYSDSIKNDSSLAEDVRREGDRDCEDAIKENDVVIARQRERIGLLKAEVERRGGRWHEAGGEERPNGHVEEGEEVVVGRGSGGRLTDEELRRRMEERMGAEGDDDDGGDGMHL
jgi:hypothetical protein